MLSIEIDGTVVTEQPIVRATAAEIKAILANRLGATLVESSDPLWTPDPEIERMQIDFRRALARLVPVFMPDLMFRLGRGKPLFKEFASEIVLTEFMPDKIFGSGSLAPIDYMVEMAEGRIQPPSNLDLATIQQQELAMAFRFHIPQLSEPSGRGLEKARTYRIACRFSNSQWALEVLGR